MRYVSIRSRRPWGALWTHFEHIAGGASTDGGPIEPAFYLRTLPLQRRCPGKLLLEQSSTSQARSSPAMPKRMRYETIRSTQLCSHAHWKPAVNRQPGYRWEDSSSSAIHNNTTERLTSSESAIERQKMQDNSGERQRPPEIHKLTRNSMIH